MKTPPILLSIIAASAAMIALSHATETHADGEASSARFNKPMDVAVSGDGSVYVADTGNHVIRKVSATGVVSTIAGTPGISGYSDGPGAKAKFDSPWCLTVGSDGTIFVSDSKNHVIRKIDVAGNVTTVAGTPGESGNQDGVGKAAKLAFPLGLCVDPQGNILLIDETPTLKRITPEGKVTTLPETVFQFGNPVDVATDAKGTIYVIERQGIIIRLEGTKAEVIVGREGSAWSEVKPEIPSSLALDAAGNIFVFEQKNRDNPAVSKVSSTERSLPFAGGGKEKVGGSYRNGKGEKAAFSRSGGISVTNDGTVFVADTYSGAIRKIDKDGVVSTLAGAPPK